MTPYDSFFGRQALIVLLLGALLLAVPSAAAEPRKNVVIGKLNWSGAIIISHVMKYVLEEKLSVPTVLREATVPVLWQAMEEGTMDVYPDLWMPNQQEAFDKYVTERGTVAARLSYEDAPQGIYMRADFAEEHGIRSVFDLRGKETLFDMNGNGVGEMWVGPYNWDAAEINRIKIRDYGLAFEPMQFEQWLFLSVLKGAMDNRKPLVFYYWEPEWPFAVYDLARLEEPAYDPDKWRRVRGEMEKSRIRCAYPPAEIYVGVSTALAQRLPGAFAFFMNWSIPIDVVSGWVADIEDVPGNPKKSPRSVAETWVESHPETLRRWLGRRN